MVRIIVIVLLFFSVVSCSVNYFISKPVPQEIIENFSYCYNDNYTGLDNLIKTNGYYTTNYTIKSDNNEANDTIIREYFNDIVFFNNGLFAYNAAIPEKYNFQRKSISSAYWGLYKFDKDTIKAKYINRPSYIAPWEAWEIWYIVINEYTIREIYIKPIHPMTESDWMVFYDYTLPKMNFNTYSFVPLTPNRDDICWLKREKWFWCNEEDWKNYMDSVNIKSKK